jgi:hypothetical protein
MAVIRLSEGVGSFTGTLGFEHRPQGYTGRIFTAGGRAGIRI